MKNLIKCELIVGVLALQTMVVSAQPYSGFGEPPPIGGTVIDFDSTTPGGYDSLTIDNVTFNGVAHDGYGTTFSIGSDFNGSFNNSGGQSLLNGFSLSPDAFSFVFGSPVSNFAFNFGASDNDWQLTAYDAGNGVLGTMTIPPVHGSNAGDYFGIAAPGIAYATLVDLDDQDNTDFAGDYIFIDDFTYVGGGTSAPDTGSSLALFGMALVPLLAIARKTRTA